MVTINGKKMYSTEDLSKLLGLTPRSIAKLRKEGLILSVRVKGGGLFTSEEMLNDYLNGKTLQIQQQQQRRDNL